LEYKMVHVRSGKSAVAIVKSGLTRRIQLVSATLSNLTNLRDQEVCHGDVADSVHGSAEGRAMGAMEERAKYCGNLSGAGKKNKTGVERIVVVHGGIVPAPRQR